MKIKLEQEVDCKMFQKALREAGEEIGLNISINETFRGGRMFGSRSFLYIIPRGRSYDFSLRGKFFKLYGKFVSFQDKVDFFSISTPFYLLGYAVKKYANAVKNRLSCQND